MDCHRTLGLALCLLTGAAGCQHQVATLPEPDRPLMPIQQAPPEANPIKKASLRRKAPPAMVLVKWGDFKAGEALSAETPARQQAMLDEARREYQRALGVDPKCVPAYQGLARVYSAMQDYGRAVETYHKALQIAPKNPSLLYELGRCHHAQKERDPALFYLGQAVQLDPENRDYLNTLGVVLAQVGRHQEALECFVRAGGEARGAYRLARTLQHLQQPELSRQYLELALQKDPSLATAQTLGGERDGGPSQTVQRTSYQEPSVPPTLPAPPTPPDPPASAPMPRVIQLNPSATNAAEPESKSTLQLISVPPPPTIILRYEEPKP